MNGQAEFLALVEEGEALFLAVGLEGYVVQQDVVVTFLLKRPEQGSIVFHQVFDVRTPGPDGGVFVVIQIKNHVLLSSTVVGHVFPRGAAIRDPLVAAAYVAGGRFGEVGGAVEFIDGCVLRAQFQDELRIGSDARDERFVFR